MEDDLSDTSSKIISSELGLQISANVAENGL